MPAGHPPLAFDGYCPVTLADQATWTKGDPRWGAVHRGRTYLFPNPAAQQRFLAAPDLYSPVLSGFDPVRYLEAGEMVEGKREHGVFYRDRVYLFADEDSLQRFGSRPDFFIAATEQAAQRAAAAGPRP